MVNTQPIAEARGEAAGVVALAQLLQRKNGGVQIVVAIIIFMGPLVTDCRVEYLWKSSRGEEPDT